MPLVVRKNGGRIVVFVWLNWLSNIMFVSAQCAAQHAGQPETQWIKARVSAEKESSAVNESQQGEPEA